MFDDYLEYGRLAASDLQGKAVLEAGPGDNLGVALLFIAAGATRAVCLDKYYAERDDGYQREVYLALRDTLEGEGRRAFDEAVSLTKGVDFNPDRIEYICGSGCEQADKVLPPRSFDLVVSRAVLQTVESAEAALTALDRVLKPGGLQLHRVDLGDYGVFTNYGFHPLEFLTTARPVYDLCVRYCHPNRERIGVYRDAMGKLGSDVEFYITKVLGASGELRPHPAGLVEGRDYGAENLRLLEEIRPRLLPEFGQLADEELLVLGFFMRGQSRV